MRRSPSETWMFSVVLCMNMCRRVADWQVSCSRYIGLAAAKHLSPKRLWTRVTEQFLPEEDLRERAELSEARWIVSQIGRYFAWQHLVYQAGNLELNSSSDRQPMKLTQYRCDVFATFGFCDQPCSSFLHRLYLPHESIGHSVQQRVAVVQSTWNERLD